MFRSHWQAIQGDHDLAFTRKRGGRANVADAHGAGDLRRALHEARQAVPPTYPTTPEQHQTRTASLQSKDTASSESPMAIEVPSADVAPGEDVPLQKAYTANSKRAIPAAVQHDKAQPTTRGRLLATELADFKAQSPTDEQSASSHRYTMRERSHRQTQPYSLHSQKDQSTFGTKVLSLGKETVEVPWTDSANENNAASLSDFEIGDTTLNASDPWTDMEMDEDDDNDESKPEDSLMDRLKTDEIDNKSASEHLQDGKDQRSACTPKQPNQSSQQVNDDQAAYQEMLRKHRERARAARNDPVKLAKIRAYSKVYHQKIKNDPVRYAEFKARQRTSTAKYRSKPKPTDPIKVAKKAAVNKAAYERIKADPVLWAERKTKSRANRVKWLQKQTQKQTHSIEFKQGSLAGSGGSTAGVEDLEIEEQ